MTRTQPAVETFLPLRPVEFQIVLALAPGARHGYGILQDALRRTDGALLLEPGTLYRALRRLLSGGLVEESEPEANEADRDDERRRYYRLTTLGRRIASAEAERMKGLVLAARESGLLGRAESPSGWRLSGLRRDEH